jgi:hypothetical protein
LFGTRFRSTYCNSIRHVARSVVADDLGMRMFFAEDEPILLEFVTRGHVEAGYAIETIVDGEDALFETSARRHGSR